jgi:uncharacterized protein (DUF1501 family)
LCLIRRPTGADSNNLVYGSAAVASALQRISRSAHGGHVLEADIADVSGRSIDAEATLRGNSDFGRTFTSNGDCTDHGWGSHQFVMGGAVRGGGLHGNASTLVAKSPGSNDFNSPDQLRNGAMLPTTSVDQSAPRSGAGSACPTARRWRCCPTWPTSTQTCATWAS